MMIIIMTIIEIHQMKKTKKSHRQEKGLIPIEIL